MKIDLSKYKASVEHPVFCRSTNNNILYLDERLIQSIIIEDEILFSFSDMNPKDEFIKRNLIIILQENTSIKLNFIVAENRHSFVENELPFFCKT